MIELNLLPDVKLQYVKTQRSQRLIISVCIIVSGLAILLLVILLGAEAVQKHNLSNLTNNINTASSQLKNEPQINKILTVQNQLSQLNTLHASEPAATQLFGDLNKITPVQADINSLSISFTAYSVAISGTADSLSTVNQFVDTLKITTYTTKTDSTPALAFSNVVLTGFGINQSASNSAQAVEYSISFAYAKDIFYAPDLATLSVPSTTTTRLSLGESGTPFDNSAPASSGSGSN